MSRLYVGNLLDSIRREDLENEFSKYGTLKNVWVAQNPPGFAFVEYEDEANANDAVSNMNDAEYFGSRITVEVSAPRRCGRGGRGGGRGFVGGRGGYDREGGGYNRESGGRGFNRGGRGSYGGGGRGSYASRDDDYRSSRPRGGHSSGGGSILRGLNMMGSSRWSEWTDQMVEDQGVEEIVPDILDEEEQYNDRVLKLNERIVAQVENVRSVNVEVNKEEKELLRLKSEFKLRTGADWKPATTAQEQEQEKLPKKAQEQESMGKVDVPVVAGTARVPKRKKKEDTKRQFKKMEEKAADTQLLKGTHRHSIKQVTPELINRLGLEAELEGHKGSVNCIDWDYTGQYIVTGSDDRTLLIWNPHTKMKIAHLSTQHVDSISSVKFMPESKNRMIAVGAADRKISFIDVESNETVTVCSCHYRGVKTLAVSNENPTLLWSGAEDCTVRQMDLREPHVCDETSSNIFVNLMVPCSSISEVKAIAMNPVRSELLAVGGNDPYARIYDRRKIKPYTYQVINPFLNSLYDRNSPENKDLLPDGCVNYFIPGHLSFEMPECPYLRHYSSIATTHVAFDPRGQKLLVNLGNEHIYLFNIFEKRQPTDICISMDKLSRAYQSGIGITEIPPAVKFIKEQADTAFQNGKYDLAIDLYNVAITKYPYSAMLHSDKAEILMKRKWLGDVYDASRTCLSAIELDPDCMKAYDCLARCLLDLKRLKEAEKVVMIIEEKFSDEVRQDWIGDLKDDLEECLKPLLHGANNECVSLDERMNCHFHPIRNHEVMTGILSPAEVVWRKSAHDYEKKFCGHSNRITGIKEANFFGGEGQYVIAGSDDGSFFVWDQETTKIARVLRGDESVVNCLQPHPTTCLLATSGRDSVVRLWSPRPENFENDRLVMSASLVE